MSPNHVFQHTPHPQQKQLLVQLEKRLAGEFAGTSARQFRSSEDLIASTWIHHYGGYFSGRTAPAKIRYDYVDPSQRAGRSKLPSILRGERFDVFCINEALAISEEDELASRALAKFFAKFAPPPCRFETS